MPKDGPATVVAIVCKNMSVLVCGHTDKTQDQECEFPATRPQEGENPVSACKRLAKDELGCRLSTTWLLHTQDCEDDGHPSTMECYVCSPLPAEEPHAQNERLRWLNREELAQARWTKEHEELARMVGIYWDHLFQAEHL